MPRGRKRSVAGGTAPAKPKRKPAPKRVPPVAFTKGRDEGDRDPRTGRYYGKVDIWKKNSAKAFWRWVEDIKPRVLVKGKYKPWEPTRRQRQAVERILDTNADGDFQNAISCLIWPRRHGKSTLMALIVLWMFTSRENWTCQLQGNTEVHSRKVQYNTLVRIISNTPELRKLIDPKRDISRTEIVYEKRGNTIQAMVGNSMSTAFGDRLDVIWTSDFHACPDLGPFNALQASMLDSDNTLLLIDSNVDSFDGHVHALQKESETDPAIFADHWEYFDSEHYYETAPEWIDRARARRLQKTLLEAEFDRDILGKRSDAKNALFSSKHIEQCKQPYKIPVDDIASIANGRKYVIGGGLDRAKGLMGDLDGGDATVWTVVAKIASPRTAEPEFHVLNQKTIIPNISANIKRIILDDHKRYNLDHVALESYETTDLVPWLANQNINAESVTPTSAWQNASFPELNRIVRDGRLFFSEDLKKLPDEMQTFSYARMANGNYTFGHSSDKFHDDTVFSLNHAIYSLRSEILNVYVLGNVQCHRRDKMRIFCFLLGGEHQLSCGERCTACQQVSDMWQAYREVMLDDDIEIQDFFKSHVKRSGATIMQAA